MDVPGLTGTWKERLAQYYKKLTGKTYRGTLEEGNYMLSQIAKQNYGATPKKTTTAKEAVPLYRQYTDPLTGQVKSASEIPQYENVMPYYEAWEQMLPAATDAATSQINPESMRQYQSQYRDYMGGMTSAGGERFGRGLSGVGTLKAESERNRQAQLQDWLGAYQKGYNTLFYEPSRDAWNKARTQVQPGGTMQQATIPTWEDVFTKTNSTYGLGGTTNSPFYG